MTDLKLVLWKLEFLHGAREQCLRVGLKGDARLNEARARQLCREHDLEFPDWAMPQRLARK